MLRRLQSRIRLRRERPLALAPSQRANIGPRYLALVGRLAVSASAATTQQELATIGADASGQAYNINADTVAGALAEALEAEKLIFLTDIEGLRVVADDPTTVIHKASLEVIDEIIRSGNAEGGMLPKVEACARAVRAGVSRAHILDGRVPHALLLELFTDAGVGTMVLP